MGSHSTPATGRLRGSALRRELQLVRVAGRARDDRLLADDALRGRRAREPALERRVERDAARGLLLAAGEPPALDGPGQAGADRGRGARGGAGARLEDVRDEVLDLVGLDRELQVVAALDLA